MVALLLFGVVLSAPVIAQVGALDVRVNRDVAGSAYSSDSQVAAQGDSVYVTWSDSRNGLPDVYFNRSKDGGVTWQRSDTRLNTATAGKAYSSFPQIVAVGSSIYITWQDGRTAPHPDIYFNRSTDGGATWLRNDVRLNTNTAGSAFSYFPKIVAVGSTVYVTWTDYRNGAPSNQPDIYFNRSTDRGTTWLRSDIRLDTDVAGAKTSYGPQIAASDSAVYVTWMDDRNGRNDIYFNRSSDRGTTWLRSDLRLNKDQAGAVHSNNPQIVAADSSVYVTWGDSRNGNLDTFFNRSTDRGTTWLRFDVRVNANPFGGSDDCALAASGSSVYVAWQDKRNGKADIYFNCSLDGGVRWLRNDRRLDTDLAGSARSYSFQLVAAKSIVFVVWADDRNGKDDIYLNCSTNEGFTWLPNDQRLDRDAAGSAASAFPGITSCGARLFVTWQDQRHCRAPLCRFKEDIYYNTYRPYQPILGQNRIIGKSCKHPAFPRTVFGPSSPGTDPHTGGRFSLSATALPPYATTYGAFGLLGLKEIKPPINLAVTGLFLPLCFLHVDYLLMVPLPRLTATSSIAKWDFDIPCDPTLVGIKFFAQVAIIDSANASYWMTTNAYQGQIGSR